MLRTLSSPFSKTKKPVDEKQVSFGEEDAVKRVSRVRPEEAAAVWYNKEELDESQRRPSFQETSAYDISARGSARSMSTVKKVTRSCRIQLERSQGEYDENAAQAMRAVSLQGSKGSSHEARRKAGTVYKEVYDREVVYEDGRNCRSLSPTRNRTPRRTRTTERVREGTKKMVKRVLSMDSSSLTAHFKTTPTRKGKKPVPKGETNPVEDPTEDETSRMGEDLLGTTTDLRNDLRIIAPATEC